MSFNIWTRCSNSLSSPLPTMTEVQTLLLLIATSGHDWFSTYFTKWNSVSLWMRQMNTEGVILKNRMQMLTNFIRELLFYPLTNVLNQHSCAEALMKEKQSGQISVNSATHSAWLSKENLKRRAYKSHVHKSVYFWAGSWLLQSHNCR